MHASLFINIRRSTSRPNAHVRQIERPLSRPLAGLLLLLLPDRGHLVAAPVRFCVFCAALTKTTEASTIVSPPPEEHPRARRAIAGEPGAEQHHVHGGVGLLHELQVLRGGEVVGEGVVDEG